MKYICTNCSYESLKWEGRCSSCGEWGTLEEIPSSAAPIKGRGGNIQVEPATAISMGDVESFSKRVERARTSSGSSEFDRVLGGGFLPGEVVLLTGEPGVGKSTILSQIASVVSQEKRILYVCGEESVGQVKDRFDRVVRNADDSQTEPVAGHATASKSVSPKKNNATASIRNIELTSDTRLEYILALQENSKYDLLIVDSIQSISSVGSESFPGSMTQVRNCGYRLVEMAKRTDTIVIIVGQINKSGFVAGPKVLEHMVDAVLHMAGDRDDYYKILRAQKNRFGSTEEIGVFLMQESGLTDVDNPSQVFLSEEGNITGCALGAIVEGSRVVFLEVQALVADHGSSPGPLLRVANGIKKQRLDMLCAVMSRRGGVFLGDKDVFMNVSGGVTVNSPSLDLAICAAIRSSFEDKELSLQDIYAGEVSLTGSVKRFLGIDRIGNEAERLGYNQLIAPLSVNSKKMESRTIKSVLEI